MGANATGGAINVIPTQPKLGDLSGYVTGSYGSYNTRTVEGALNAPLGEDGAVRVSGSVAQHDGYLRDGTYDNDTKSLRVQLKGKLTPNLTVRVAGDYEHVGGTSFGTTLIGSYLQTAAGNSFLPSGLSLAEGSLTPAAQAYATSLNAGTAKRPYDAATFQPYHHDNFFGANAQIDWTTPIGTLTVIPAWRYSSLDNFTNSGETFLYRAREKDQQYSLEARLAGNRIGIFDYVLGGLFYHEDINSSITVNVRAAASFPGPNRYNTNSFAPFGRLTAHLTDKLRVVGGVRYTKDTKTFTGTTVSFQMVCVAASCPTVPLLPPVDYYTQYPFPYSVTAGVVPYAPGAVLARGATRNDNSRLVNDRVTYHGGVEYDLAPQSLLYATVESGYRAGGFSPATGFETYQPEFITAYTVGTKNRFLNNRVQLNLEGFLWNYNNQQISHVGVDLSGRAANFTQNVGKSRIKGFEVEGRVLITPTTLVSADVQYLDARYLSLHVSAALHRGGPAQRLRQHDQRDSGDRELLGQAVARLAEMDDQPRRPADGAVRRLQVRRRRGHAASVEPLCRVRLSAAGAGRVDLDDQCAAVVRAEGRPMVDRRVRPQHRGQPDHPQRRTGADDDDPVRGHLGAPDLWRARIGEVLGMGDSHARGGVVG